MRLVPASKLGRTVFGAVVGGVAGLLMAIGLIVLCVAVCAAVAPSGAEDEGWIAIVGLIIFWSALICGPLLGAIVGARRMRRGPCPPGTDGKPAQ